MMRVTRARAKNRAWRAPCMTLSSSSWARTTVPVRLRVAPGAWVWRSSSQVERIFSMAAVAGNGAPCSSRGRNRMNCRWARAGGSAVGAAPSVIKVCQETRKGRFACRAAAAASSCANTGSSSMSAPASTASMAALNKSNSPRRDGSRASPARKGCMAASWSERSCRVSTSENSMPDSLKSGRAGG